MHDPSDELPTPSNSRRILAPLLLLGLPILGIAIWLGTTYWASERAESEAVTGAVPVLRDGVVHVVVSGHSEKTTQRGDKRGSVSTTAYPHLTSYRATDGERVARRHYAPVFLRFEYVDTVVRALLAGAGKAWIVSTAPAGSLHAVHPATLADELDWAGLVSRFPVLGPGLFIERGSSSSPVLVGGRELLFRLNSGPFQALAPETLELRALPAEGEALEDITRAGDPRGAPELEKRVEGLPEYLEPVVPVVRDLDGRVDTTTGYVVSQTSLDRERAGIRVTRWDLSRGADAASKGWETTLDVAPDCCQRVVWRFDGLALLWYEQWLIAFDDATGAVRWQRRL